MSEPTDTTPTSPTQQLLALAAALPVTAPERHDLDPLTALAANAQLVQRLTGQRWYVIRDARENGASWEDISAALGTSVNEVHAFYREAIARQEQHVGDLHDTARARAVLGDDDQADAETAPVSLAALHTTTTVVFPVSGVADLADPLVGRVVIPERVELTLNREQTPDGGVRVWANVAVYGPRRLKSGQPGREISVYGWERAENRWRNDRSATRPDWLTARLAEHLPEGWAPSMLDLPQCGKGGEVR